jgi:hypothetical protein
MTHRKEANDVVVVILNWIVNVYHILAFVVLVYGNIWAYEKFTQEMPFKDIFLLHSLGSIAFIINYVLGMGTISLFISMNRNLQRLVNLQSGTTSGDETPKSSVPIFKPLRDHSKDESISSGTYQASEFPTAAKVILIILIIAGGVAAFVWSVSSIM